MIRHRKGPGVLAQKRIKSSRSPHYIQAYLWESRDAMEAGVAGENEEFQESPHDGVPGALCCLSVYTEKIDRNLSEIVFVRPRLAEVHFFSGGWDGNVVAHELTHALIHRMRTMPPFAREVISQHADSEEIICYEMGNWFQECYAWLWETDPDTSNRA